MTPVLVGRALAAASLVLLSFLPAACTSPPADPVRVVAVAAATAVQARPALGEQGIAAIRSAAESDRGSFALVVAGAPEQSRDVDLVARRDTGGRTEVEHGPRRAALLEQRVADASVAVAAAGPAAGAPDLLGALDEGARGVPGTLLVVDSGITTTDPVDMRRLGWSADPAPVVAALRASDSLPDLRGWDVVFSGLGRTVAPQQAPGTPGTRWLKRWWTTLCAAGGARSCQVEDPAGPPREPAAGIRTAPVVDVPAVRTVALAGGGVEATIPDSRLGFEAGSAALGPDAGDAVEPVVQAYRRAPGHVRVDGYVAFWGTQSYRGDLAQARAAAVGDLLVARGVARADVTAVGRGAADGPGASTTDGVFDESKVTANGVRRVVVTLTP